MAEPFTSCELRALTWEGPPPVDGAFLVTSGGSAYRIDEVREMPSGSYRLRCTRWPLAEVPDDAMRFHWTWNLRLPARHRAGAARR